MSDHARPPAPDDEALRTMMTNAAGDDDAAFAAVVAALSGRVLRYLRCAGESYAEAEDILQETWVRVYRNRGRYRRERSVSAWVFAIARNRMIDLRRRRPSEVPLVAESLASAAAEPEPNDSEAAQDLWDRVRGIVSSERFDILWLHYGEGFSTAAIARVLGLTSINVRVQLHRARAQLAQAMQGKERP